MNQFLKILLSVFLLSFSPSLFAAEKSVLNIQHWQTKNGVPVYFIAAPQLPMLDIQVVFNAGSARDGNLAGLAKATIMMLNQGAAKLSADQIALQFDQVGAQYGATVNRDMALIQLRSLTAPKFLDPALQTFTSVLTAPTFPGSAWQRIQKQILVALQAEQESPLQIAQNNFLKTLYGNQLYAHSVIGTVETISKLSSQDLSNFYKQYYIANNAMIMMVGAVDKQIATKVAEQIAEKLPAGKAVAPLPVMVGPKKSQTLSIAFPSQQTTILMGQVGVNQLNPDYFPLYVGNYILGGGELVSRLFTEVRDKRGLTYGIGSKFSTLAAHGPFYIVLQSRNDKANSAITVTQKILQSFVKSGPTEQELVVAKKSIIGEFPLRFSSNADLLSHLVNIAFYHLPLDYYDTYRQKIDAVTIQQIQNAFQQHINPNTMTVVTVGKPVTLTKRSEK